MAVIDLTNDITPKHAYRPIAPKLSELRAAITDADTSNAYSSAFLEKCNRNDLVYIARTLGVEFPFPAPIEEE